MKKLYQEVVDLRESSYWHLDDDSETIIENILLILDGDLDINTTTIYNDIYELKQQLGCRGIDIRVLNKVMNYFDKMVEEKK